MKMNEQECRQLDAWIAEKVFHYKRTDDPDSYTDTDETLFWIHDQDGRCLSGRAYTGEFMNGRYDHSWEVFAPTTDPAASRELEKRLLKDWELSINESAQHTTVSTMNGRRLSATAQTLELALCLLAKQLYAEKNR